MCHGTTPFFGKPYAALDNKAVRNLGFLFFFFIVVRTLNMRSALLKFQVHTTYC